MYRRYIMKLKKLLKHYDKSSYIQVFDTLTGITTQPHTVESFIKMYGKDILERKILDFDVSDACNYTIIVSLL